MLSLFLLSLASPTVDNPVTLDDAINTCHEAVQHLNQEDLTGFTNRILQVTPDKRELVVMVCKAYLRGYSDAMKDAGQ